MLIRTLRLIRACMAIHAWILLSACSALLAENTASEMVPDGSHLIVNQLVVIPTNKARVYIQHGKVIAENQRDQYKPYCWFQSWKVLDVPQEIKPDTFKIKSSRRYEEMVHKASPLLLAASTHTQNTIQLSLASVTAIEQNTVLYIHSENHPDIRELVCGYWDDPVDDRHLTLQEIRAALGDVVQLKLANQ
jgi:hypothetical protein